MDVLPTEPVLRLRTPWGRSARPKSRQGGASAEAGQTLSSNQGEEVLEKKLNKRYKARRHQREANRQKEAGLGKCSE